MIFIYVFQDKNLKRSVTSPASVSDWLTSNHTAAGADAVEKGNVQLENHCPRQRTWSARTFHDFLAPIPQLQKKWCSWTTNSPFTKLVDNSVSLARRGGCGGRALCPSTPSCSLMGHVFPWPTALPLQPQCITLLLGVWETLLPNYIVIYSGFPEVLRSPALSTWLRNDPQSRKTLKGAFRLDYLIECSDIYLFSPGYALNLF